MKADAALLGRVSLAVLKALRAQHGDLDRLLRELEQLGPLALVGGAPRDWLLQREPRDLDLVVDADPDTVARVLSPLALRRTRFGGFVVAAGDRSLDIWPLASTWAFSAANPRRADLGAATLEALPHSAFFNLDAVAVRLRDGQVFEAGFFEGLKKRTLAPVFTPNPFVPLCTARAGVLSRRYGVTPSVMLRDFFVGQVLQGLRWSQVAAAQRSHYGCTLLSKPQVTALLFQDERIARRF